MNPIKVGYKGTLYFVTNYDDTEKNIFDVYDIENRTHFDTILKDTNGNEYYINCRLWKPIGDNLRVFCELDDYLNYNEQEVTLNYTSFTYGKYTIYILSEEPIQVTQIDNHIPFLYSQKQQIDISDKNSSYYLFKFNI